MVATKKSEAAAYIAADLAMVIVPIARSRSMNITVTRKDVFFAGVHLMASAAIVQTGNTSMEAAKENAAGVNCRLMDIVVTIHNAYMNSN